jgi:hypothetical protein
LGGLLFCAAPKHTTWSWKLGFFGIMPDRFAYQASWRATDRRTSYTARIPRSAVDCLNIDLVSIAANAELTNCGVAWGH